MKNDAESQKKKKKNNSMEQLYSVRTHIFE